MLTVDKKDIATKLNTVLGTDIDWTKLSKEDLAKLSEIFTTGAGKLLEIALRNATDDVIDKIGNLRIRELISNARGGKGGMFGFGLLQSDKGGPLGLGVLPKLRGIIEGEPEKSEK